MTGDVLATVIHDAINNGVANAGEPRLSGWTIYVDFDRDATFDAGEPTAVTNSSGQTRITGVPDNTWDIREIVPTGYAPANGFDDFERIRVRDGETVNVSFLNVSTSGAGGTIQGTVWNDVDQAGVRDASDPGIPGWTIFLDLNTDGFLNAVEPSTITDANGAYSFTGLAPGRHRVGEITPSGWDTAVGTDGAPMRAGQAR